MEMVVTTAAVRVQSSSQIVNKLFTGGMPFLSPNQQCQSTEGKD